MKNQYFGDVNDFFKYDLVLTLIEGLGGRLSFTFIPMLTAADRSRDGGRIEYKGNRRPDLASFLKECTASGEEGRDGGKRRITELHRFFDKKNIQYWPYCDDDCIPDRLFSRETRRAYFEGIDRKMLEQTVILLDPDNGMEVASMHPGNGHKYVTYEEVRTLYHRMSDDSLLLVYQHFPRVPRKKYIEERCAEMKAKSGTIHIIAIWNCRIAFFIAAKDVVLVNEAYRIVREMKEDYSRRCKCEAYNPENPAERV